MNEPVFRTRVKICGITRIEDARHAVRLGADAIGLVFFRGSPRYVSIEQAQNIAQVVPGFVARVGLFVNASLDEIHAVAKRVPLDLIQFHGDEQAEFCEQVGLPYIKALKIRSAKDFELFKPEYLSARGVLVDAYSPVLQGGTGKTFDWSLIPPGFANALVLAGGLTDQNVAEAIQRVKPYAVDVSSGVEVAPGIKELTKLQKFMTEVRHADAARDA